MEQIFIALKKDMGRIQFDANMPHAVTRLSNEGDVPTTTKRSKVDYETWVWELCKENTQVFSRGIQIADIRDEQLQWVAKVIITKFMSMQKHTYIPSGVMLVLP